MYPGFPGLYGPAPHLWSRALPTHTFSTAWSRATRSRPRSTRQDAGNPPASDRRDRRDGRRSAFFELNGQPRVIRVPNRLVKSQTAARPKADPANEPMSAHRCRASSPRSRWRYRAAGEPGRPAAIHRGDEDGDRPACRPRGHDHRAACPTGEQIDAKDLMVEIG